MVVWVRGAHTRGHGLHYGISYKLLRPFWVYHQQENIGRSSKIKLDESAFESVGAPETE